MKHTKNSKWELDFTDLQEQIDKTVDMINERKTIFTVNIDVSTLTKYEIREYMKKLMIEYKKRKT